MKCHNSHGKTYTGNEKTPLGLGYTELIGKGKTGKNMWLSVQKTVRDGNSNLQKLVPVDGLTSPRPREPKKVFCFRVEALNKPH